MSVGAVRACLDERGRLLLAGSLHGPLGRLVHGEHVHPVGDLFRHVVGASPAIHVPHCRGALERGAHPVAVVLHYEHHGELPQRRHVERFVERADVDRRLAEEADGDLVGAAVLGGEGGACRQRQVCAHDAVPAARSSRCVCRTAPPSPHAGWCRGAGCARARGSSRTRSRRLARQRARRPPPPPARCRGGRTRRPSPARTPLLPSPRSGAHAASGAAGADRSRHGLRRGA
jgi:hypothetical protein